MDVVGSILNFMEKPPLRIKKENEDNKKEKYRKHSSNKHFRRRNSYKQSRKSDVKPSIKQELPRQKISTGCNIKNALSLASYNVNIKNDINLDKPGSGGVSNQQVDSPSTDQELNTDEELHTEETFKPLYKCQVCGKIYNVRKQFINHNKNHKRNKISGKHPFKKPDQNSEFSTNLPKTNLTTTDTIIDANGNEQSYNTNQQEKSVSICHSDTLSKNLQTETTYKCKICDRTFTKKKTFLNHKSNHVRNRNTAKFLFFQRANGKDI